jgi:propanol-preferring alcohol dehydrogenase
MLQIDGGYTEYTVADTRYCFPLPEEYDDVRAAPLMCAGLIGYRCFKKANLGDGDLGGKRLGICGFGAAGHIVAQVGSLPGGAVRFVCHVADTSLDTSRRYCRYFDLVEDRRCRL